MKNQFKTVHRDAIALAVRLRAEGWVPLSEVPGAATHPNLIKFNTTVRDFFTAVCRDDLLKPCEPQKWAKTLPKLPATVIGNKIVAGPRSVRREMVRDHFQVINAKPENVTLRALTRIDKSRTPFGADQRRGINIKDIRRLPAERSADEKRKTYKNPALVQPKPIASRDTRLSTLTARPNPRTQTKQQKRDAKDKRLMQRLETRISLLPDGSERRSLLAKQKQLATMQEQRVKKAKATRPGPVVVSPQKFASNKLPARTVRAPAAPRVSTQRQGTTPEQRAALAQQREDQANRDALARRGRQLLDATQREEITARAAVQRQERQLQNARASADALAVRTATNALASATANAAVVTRRREALEAQLLAAAAAQALADQRATALAAVRRERDAQAAIDRRLRDEETASARARIAAETAQARDARSRETARLTAELLDARNARSREERALRESERLQLENQRQLERAARAAEAAMRRRSSGGGGSGGGGGGGRSPSRSNTGTQTPSPGDPARMTEDEIRAAEFEEFLADFNDSTLTDDELADVALDGSLATLDDLALSDAELDAALGGDTTEETPDDDATPGDDVTVDNMVDDYMPDDDVIDDDVIDDDVLDDDIIVDDIDADEGDIDDGDGDDVIDDDVLDDDIIVDDVDADEGDIDDGDGDDVIDDDITVDDVDADEGDIDDGDGDDSGDDDGGWGGYDDPGY